MKKILLLLTTAFLALGFTLQAQGPISCKLKSKFSYQADKCTVTFSDASAAGIGTTITSWFWNFGDGNTSTLQNPTHVYTASGTYTVCLSITGVNAAGVQCKDQICLPVKVKDCNVSYPCKLSAKFKFKVDSCNVSFYDFSVAGTGTTITSWFWDFGDGNNSTLQNPTHVYATSGTYTVCLTVVGVNAAGILCKDQICLPVKVKGCNPYHPCKLAAKFDFKIDSCKVSFFDFSGAGPGTTITSWFWDFGDGNTSTLQNPIHVYATSGTYNVCLTIVGVNAFGEKCTDKLCLLVKVKACGQSYPCQLFPKFDFKVDSCKVSFFDLSASGPGTTITSWFWDFGDGNTSTLQNPTHVYAVSGTYNVCLTIVGNNGVVKCKEKFCFPVTVKNCNPTNPCQLFPKFDFKIDSCKVSFFDFSGAGPGTTITSWFWDFGDGNTSTLQNPTHVYTTSGTYVVCLTITGAGNGVVCKEKICMKITVNCGQTNPCQLFPKFDFKIDSCKVSFFDFSGAGPGTTITSWFWDFGDGNTSTLQNPTHVYATSGTYVVCLTITGAGNGVICKERICMTIVVHCGQTNPCQLFPKFDFKIDSCKVSFFDFSVAGPGTTITNWFWDFGDGNTSTLQNPTHVYATSGTYVVCLTIVGVNSAGIQCKERICMTITVHCGQTNPCQLFPKFDFKIDSCKVSFFDFSVAGPGTTITNWFWDFGDGNTSTLQNPTHVYATSGTYVVCLTIVGVNSAGIQCKERICMTITVNCGQTNPCQLFPKFDFKIDSCKVSFFDFSGAGPGTTITNWFWDFGDGNTSTLQNPTHVYATSGTYVVCLTIVGVNSAGLQCKERICMTITVHCGQTNPCQLFPKFDFKIDSCKVSFFDFSSAGPGTTITNWFWDFGDGNTSTLQNPTHVYATSGTYVVCLTIVGVNSAGLQCKERICMTITVHCGQTNPCQLFPKFDFKIDSCKVSFFDFSGAGPGTTITNWFWDFGDGNTSTLQNPTHVYATSGTYVVCLTITGAGNGVICKERICMTIVVHCGQTNPCQLFPKFDFKIDSCKVSFFDFSSAGPGTTITNWFWDFGDGNTSTLQNPTHVYATSGTYVVCLTIVGVNSAGLQCKERICMTITVHCGQTNPCQLFPKFDFKIDSCKVSFFDFSSAGPSTTITNWFWDFGDGNTSTLQNPTHVYATSGTYVVCLTIVGVNAAGIQCKERICMTITVHCAQTNPCQLFPKFDFKIDSCKVSFFDFSSAGLGTTITNWFWDFGDGNTSTLQNPTHVYATSGTYVVCLTIVGVNSAGIQCKERICMTITVHCAQTNPCQLFPKFDFKIDSCKVSFFDFSSAGAGTTITGWFWDFGDGNTSTLQNPTHVYATSGTYIVCLTITGTGNGVICKERICMTITVQCGQTNPCQLFPRFDFKIDSCKVSFFDFSGAGPGTNITNWFWDFGDGNTSTLQNPTHVYATSGTYNVCLIIVGINAAGEQCKDKICLLVTVKDCGQTNPCQLFPKFDFKIDGCTVSFFDFSGTGPGTTITNWFWDFGDGNTSTLQNPAHVYATSGTYTVCLTIVGVNAAGLQCKERICMKITVECGQTNPCQLLPRFDFKIDSCKVSFFDFSIAGPGTMITNWFWDFGDGNTSTLQNPTHVYAASGTYTVCLTIGGVNAAGLQCKERICLIITVNNCPRAGTSSNKINPTSLMLAIYPNPAHHSVNISFSMSREENVTVSVTDVQGRTLAVLQNGKLTTGNHNLTWKVEAPAGCYLVTIKTDSGIERKQVLVQ